MPLIQAVVGFASLFFGRLLFWLFVGAAGFVLGFELALSFLGERALWLVLIAALIAGMLGSFVATIAQRLAVAVAGFFAGGYFLWNLIRLLGVVGDEFNTVAIILYFAGGVVGAGLVSLLFDPALILLSSALGATLLAQAADAWFDLEPPLGVLVVILLFVVGVAAQWGVQRSRGERVEPRQRGEVERREP